MIYTEMTVRALKLAWQAHCGQLDKSGLPYILHPLHLAESMPDELTTCAALLHDTVEDTFVTLADIRRDFPEEIAEAVRLLTHADDVPYLDYVRAIGKNRIARTVKLADLRHNSDTARLTAAGMDVTERDEARVRKYALAIELLEDEEDE